MHIYMHTYVYTHSLQLKIIQIIKVNLKVYIKYQIYFLKGN